MTASLSTSAETTDDAALMARVVEGDRTAFSLLVERHEGAVFRLARLATASDAQAEEVLQETFLTLFRKASTWRGEGSARSWLLTVARHHAHRTRRLRAGEPEDKVPLHELGAQAGWGAEPMAEHLAEVSERRALLDRALARLGGADREVLVLRDLEELSGDEAAAVLGLSLAAVKSRLHRARLRFASALRTEVNHGA